MNQPILIIGFGRFGKVLAELLAQDFDIFVRQTSDQQASRITAAGFAPVKLSGKQEFAAVFLCVPISALEKTLVDIAPNLPKSAIIIDTCSVKEYPLTLMQKYLSDFHYIATHPLFGPDSIDSGLVGKRIIFCEGTATEQQRKFWMDYFGRRSARIVELSAAEHDQQAAYTQGLAHYLGRILADLHLKDVEVVTKGYADLSDLVKQTSADSWQLFDDLQSYNKFTAQMRDDFERSHDEIKERLDVLLEGHNGEI